MKKLLMKKGVQTTLGVIAVLFICAAMVWSQIGSKEALPLLDLGIPWQDIVTNEPEPVVEKPAQYIEIIDSCGPYYEGVCVNMREGPGSQFPAVLKLRTGVVLKVAGVESADGRMWYKVSPGDDLRYPERVTSDWYVASEYARLFEEKENAAAGVPGAKRILVDRSEQMLYAYEGDTLFMQQSISTGLDLTPTPRGNFKVYKKTPSRYMQGPIEGISDQYYDLPGVPWNLYFTLQGGVIHGAYWHDKFGEPWSHGCVNLPIDKARELYEWANLGTPILVQD